MHLDDLGLFLRVAQSLLLNEAARQLDQTPSAVSARLKRIEEEPGVRLVERATRSLRLTPEGACFMQTCDTMTSTWTRGQSMLRQGARSVEGRMHIAAPTDTCAQIGACERIPQARIFELELLQPTGLDVTCGTILRFPRAKRRAADAVIPAQVHDRGSRFDLAQQTQDLRFGKSPSHGTASFSWRRGCRHDSISFAV